MQAQQKRDSISVKHLDSYVKERQEKGLVHPGDYVPIAILIVNAAGQSQNYHLPQKLFAIKSFTQMEVLQGYHFRNPLQTTMLNDHQDIGAFNAAVCNFHRFLVTNGYCREEGKPELMYVMQWTPEEIEEENKKKQFSIRAAADMTKGMAVAKNHDELVLRTDLQDVNVGTIGHIDHGPSMIAAGIIQ
jgi:hypothetical protein